MRLHGRAAWHGFYLLLALGTFLTLRGYQSREGDQTHRLPLLYERLDPTLYRDDPFVRAFDAFNPHAGSLSLMAWASQPLGVSAALFGLFAISFLLTCHGLERLTRSVWPLAPPGLGWCSVALVMLAKAGNVGTNHLFEPMLLDRLLALGLFWTALAWLIHDPGRSPLRAALAIALATWIHPSLGTQLLLWLVAMLAAWACWPSWSGVSRTAAARGALVLCAVAGPMVARQLWVGRTVLDGLPVENMLWIAGFIQSPQHLIPHLWRLPQWLAFGGFISLVLCEFINQRIAEPREQTDDPLAWPRRRLILGLAVLLAGLAIAWWAIEYWREPRVILFQPFRMATVARGVMLVLIAGRIGRLWSRGGFDRIRAVVLVAALPMDWSWVIVALAETTWELTNRLRPLASSNSHSAPTLTWSTVLLLGGLYLSRHDPQSAHWLIVLGLGLGVASVVGLGARRPPNWDPTRCLFAMGLAWLLPLVAMVTQSGWLPPSVSSRFDAGITRLAEKWRFGETPTHPLERLAVWCRDHTPPDARFIGPPNPKTFRLWSRRTLAFNRSSSPYHARGLADWSSRFQDHVNFHGSTREFAEEYLRDRQALESRYDTLSPEQLLGLASRQSADHVLTQARVLPDPRLEFLHAEGRFAVYRIVPDQVAATRSSGPLRRRREKTRRRGPGSPCRAR